MTDPSIPDIIQLMRRQAARLAAAIIAERQRRAEWALRQDIAHVLRQEPASFDEGWPLGDAYPNRFLLQRIVERGGRHRYSEGSWPYEAARN